MIWNVALLQFVRRTAELVDTSHPSEDSRQIGIFKIDLLW